MVLRMSVWLSSAVIIYRDAVIGSKGGCPQLDGRNMWILFITETSLFKLWVFTFKALEGLTNM